MMVGRSPWDTTEPPESGSGLLWIGNRNDRFFRPVTELCHDKFHWVAFRSGLEDAIRRPAVGIEHVVVARPDSRALNSNQLDTARRMYASAEWFESRSPLCESFYRVPDSRFNGGVIRWDNLGNVLWPQRPTATTAGLVVIRADRSQSAQPYLELCEAMGRAAVYVRRDVSSVRGATEVWWDDSLDSGTVDWRANDWPAVDWRARQTAYAVGVRHVWITSHADGNLPNDLPIRVVTKPFDISAFLGGDPSAETAVCQPSTGNRVNRAA